MQPILFCLPIITFSPFIPDVNQYIQKFIILIQGHALFGAGSTPLWPLGVSYIDDHVVVRKMPIYLGE